MPQRGTGSMLVGWGCKAQGRATVGSGPTPSRVRSLADVVIDFKGNLEIQEEQTDEKVWSVWT